jgi:hypothetical protein
VITPSNPTLSSSAATLVFQTVSSAPNHTTTFWAGTANQPKGFLVITPASPGIYACSSTATTTTGAVLLPASSSVPFNIIGNDALYLIAGSGSPTVGLLVAGE